MRATTLKPDERNILTGALAAFAALYGLGWWAIGAVATIPALGAVFAIVVYVQLAAARRTRNKMDDQMAQIQALMFLQARLDTPLPLPPLGGAALAPDCAALLVGLIQRDRPALILELGSGISTLIAAHCLRMLGNGRIVSVEHDPYYAEITRAHLRQHGLEQYAEVRDASLEPVEIEGRTWQWYAIAQLATGAPIDLLIVDGPPRKVQRLARYPAIPVLSDRLSPQSLILVDDADRADEREILRLWKRYLPAHEEIRLPTIKGTVVFERRAHGGSVPAP